MIRNVNCGWEVDLLVGVDVFERGLPPLLITAQSPSVPSLVVVWVPAGGPFNDVDQARLNDFDVPSCHMCKGRKFKMPAICGILAHALQMHVQTPLVVDERFIAGLVPLYPVTDILA